MSKEVDLSSKEWCDLVFDGKNKDFGAYQMRMTSVQRHNKAMICTIIGLIAVVILAIAASRYQQYRDEEAARLANEQEIAQMEQASKEEEKPEPPAPPVQKVTEQKEQVLPEEVQKTIKNTEYLIAKDNEVKEEVKSTDELNASTVASGVKTNEFGTEDRNVTRQQKDEIVVEKKTEPVVAKPEPEKVFTSVEQPPTFPGGDAALLKWIGNHLKYPQIAQENGIEGRVVVQFVVTKTGKVGEVKVVRSVDRDLDREAVRVCKMLPDFTPGRQNGQAVNVWYTLPVMFRLQK